MEDSTANLRNLLAKIAKENDFSNFDVKLKPISSGGANYTSQLYLATISNESKDLNLFAKVIVLGEKIRAKGLDKIFEIEDFVYTKLSQIYRQLEEKHNVPVEHRLEFSKFYGQIPTQGQEVLVLEDLSAQGYSVYDRFKSVDWPYAFRATREMAKLHALSFAFEQEHPEEFQKTQKILKNSLDNNDEQIQDFVKGALETAFSVAEEENRRRLYDFITKPEFIIESAQYLNPVRRTALIHGDFRVSNLMHKVDDEGIYQLKILDYQTMRAGSPVIDLLYFIFTGTDEKFRAEYYLPLLDHYYSELSLAMENLDLKPNEIYSRDDFNTELKMKLPYGFIIAACVLPIVMVEEEDAPIMDKDKDIMMFKVEKVGKLFPERLNGVLSDYVRWKVL